MEKKINHKVNISKHLNDELLSNTMKDLDGTNSSYVKNIHNEIAFNLFWKAEVILGTMDKQNYDGEKITDKEILELTRDRTENLIKTINRLSELKEINSNLKSNGCLVFINTNGAKVYEEILSLQELGWDQEVLQGLSHTEAPEHLYQEVVNHYKKQVVFNTKNYFGIDKKDYLELDIINGISEKQEQKLINLKTDKNLQLLKLADSEEGNPIYVFVTKQESFALNCNKYSLYENISKTTFKEAKEIVSMQVCGRKGQ